MVQPDQPSSKLKKFVTELKEEKKDFAVPSSPQSRVATAVRALRHRNFRLFFGGQLISLVGTWMQTVAQS